MRLVLLTSLTMIAFAANSILNRLAVDGGTIDPGSFAMFRVLSGAVMLAVLVYIQGGHLAFGTRQRFIGAGSLALYMVGFSLAYRALDAGLGALILFAVVQTTMFGITAVRGTKVTAQQLAGALVALAGLAWVVWPSGQAAVAPKGVLLMAAAGIGWAIYTLNGRGESDPLSATAANFCLCLPLTVAVILALGAGVMVTPLGLLLAAISGAVTSGLGYALWYSVLPHLTAVTAATIQLCVPVIAIAGGVLLLGEEAGLRLVLGGALVLGGIALAIRRT